jgi:hypothetical protein
MKEVKLAESTFLVLSAQLLFNQLKIVCVYEGCRRRRAGKSIIHAIHIHRDSCYWLIEKAFIAVE